ncbi:imidazoleglycerol-phosphate dehydratase HisB [Saccharibacter floricola]|uniref:Imidazoleglycerol-phosphate dehydratase n=1 Tax=Saccharibacter floricola DSM 15669 TaxID=1123227 RepID=A0ABQ0P0M0_9PROT|nr:imidazoleglycerol-phosphate dehydratase HisB [Saccharibacter floricola]GBQ08356.1 imidazoleglycerol-phosphate dehydratase [Saccharibacter floricola DSM 15669]
MNTHTSRSARLTRRTGETDISVSLCLDGQGKGTIETGVGFFDHMLNALARHGGLDLDVHAQGDLHIDDHHTIEDIGIALGDAFRKAIGDKRGIERFGYALVPLDEALCESVVDVSGRPFLAWDVSFPREMIGTMATEMVEEFFRAFAMAAHLTVHVTCKSGKNAHHIAESAFKSFARALRMAIAPDPRSEGTIPSTKGVL